MLQIYLYELADISVLEMLLILSECSLATDNVRLCTCSKLCDNNNVRGSFEINIHYFTSCFVLILLVTIILKLPIIGMCLHV